MKEVYDFSFIVENPEPFDHTYVTVSDVSGKEEAIEKMSQLLDAKNPVIQSIRDVTKEKEKEGWTFFVFSSPTLEENVSVYFGEKSLAEAINKCEKMMGPNNLKLVQVSITKEEKGDSSFNLYRQVKNPDGKDDYVIVLVNAKNLKSAIEQAEEITGLKGFYAKSIYQASSRE